MRVLALCRRYDDESSAVVLDGRRPLELLGLVALIDPLRPEVVDAVDDLRRRAPDRRCLRARGTRTQATLPTS
jgi:magnesium-transporting ATPase (P-type)